MGAPAKKRVVVTGIGLVSSIGKCPETFWKNLVAGQSGIGPISRFDATEFPTKHAAEVKEFDPAEFLAAKELKRMSRSTQFMMASAGQAIREAGLDGSTAIDLKRVGVILGTGIGGIEEVFTQYDRYRTSGLRGTNPFTLLMVMPNALSGEIAIRYGFRGANFTLNSACASASHALGIAFREIQRGSADICVSGGAEALIHPMCLLTFATLRTLSKSGVARPFDRERDGIVIGEGAAAFALEELEHALARGAHIHAEVLGQGMSSDAYHCVAPEPSGKSAAEAIRLALDDAGIPPSAVAYVNAHATGTKIGDVAEVHALKAVFGDPLTVPVSATKSLTGHLVGASGAVEFAATVLAVENDIIPPTGNYSTPDPECDVDCVPNSAREQELPIAISNSFGFGGHNSCLVVAKYS